MIWNNGFNIVLFILTAVTLGLSIWSFVTKCKDKSHFAGQILSASNCKNSPLYQQGDQAVEECEKNMNTLSQNIGAQGWGQPGNYHNGGLTYPGGVYGGSFGNPKPWNWKTNSNN
jgi:hypothetical protein